ncbi:MAG: flagellar biosynthetic protein FliO [Rhodoferax sp.]|uniref:flagellar biosynthetic protein FliO n=1 Tax=Rhodoferax sp. TaxID=50421 RepID=UPI003BB5469A
MKRQALKLAASLLAGVSFGAAAMLPTVPAAAEPVRAYGATGMLQAGLGLALVLALIFLLAWAARRLGLQPPGSSRLLKVVASAMVGQRERVVVVEIGHTWLVLGVAAGQVRALHTLPAEPSSEAVAAPPGNGFTAEGTFAEKLLASLHKLNKPGKPG